MKEKKIMDLTDKNIMNTYRRVPIALVKGEGARLWDANGKEYLDFVAGIAVCNLGHSHPNVVKAIKKQAKNLMHVSNLYYTRPQGEVAGLLTKHSFADKVFFCNSGAEANEAAIKLARKYAHENLGDDKFELITMKDSFHGRTMATITATGQEKFQFGFTPLLEGFKYVPFNNPAALEDAISPRTCGIMLEPIQGEGGVIIPDGGYLEKVRDICDRHRILMIVDEVQTGAGRTGYLYAYQHYNVVPDILTSAKGLGGGFPIGAMLAKEAWAQVFQPGTHGTTFGGNPLAATVANAVLAHLDAPLLAGVGERHALIVDQLNAISARYDAFSAVRGTGLLIGAELAGPLRGKAKTLTNLAAEEGLIALIAGPDVLRFAPALNIPLADIAEAFVRLDRAVARLTR